MWQVSFSTSYLWHLRRLSSLHQQIRLETAQNRSACPLVLWVAQCANITHVQAGLHTVYCSRPEFTNKKHFCSFMQFKRRAYKYQISAYRNTETCQSFSTVDWIAVWFQMHSVMKSDSCPHLSDQSIVQQTHRNIHSIHSILSKKPNASRFRSLKPENKCGKSKLSNK